MSLSTLIYTAVPTPPPIDPQDPVANHPAAKIARRLLYILVPLASLIGFLQRALGPRAHLAYTRISRAHNRLARALAHLAAGRTPRRRTPPPAPAPRIRAQQTPPLPTLPRRHGWLATTLDHNARALANHLRILLHEPGTAETIAASPGATRTLRPLCRLLGVDLPEPLRLPPRPPKHRPPKHRPPSPTPATEPTQSAPPPEVTPPPRGKYPNFRYRQYRPGKIPSFRPPTLSPAPA